MQATEPKNIRIYMESNPNPNSMKFMVSEMLVPTGMTFDFPDPASAAEAPLAQELFMYPFVDRVFYMSNFVTVTKKPDVEWMEIQQTLRDHIRDFLQAGRLILDKKAPEGSGGDDSEAVRQIKSILEEYIRPAVEQDGGAISFHSFENGVVRVTLQGSCSGCPSSAVTLKAGIENLFRRMMPEEVQSVEAIS